MFLDEALDKGTKKVTGEFSCPHCGSSLNKRKNLERRFETVTDKKLSDIWRHIMFRSVMISYRIGKKRFEKKPDAHDLATLNKIANLSFPENIPSNRFPIEEMYHGSRIAPKGFTHIHHFFLPRAAQVLGILWQKAQSHKDTRVRDMLLFTVEQCIGGMSILNRHHVIGRANVNQQMNGVYYIPSISEETSYWRILEGKVERLISTFSQYSVGTNVIIGTGSTEKLQQLDESVDYIFTDPPFGENIFYADLNFLVEAWYGVLSNATNEAIVDKHKKKGLPEYQELMRRCFAEYYRVLKPGHWITIVFHNSRNAVWNAIQEALQSVGFVVADVRTLDKQQGSYRQVTSMATKQDLVISAYKANGGLEERFKLVAGTEDSVWDFVRTHLGNLPVFVNRNGKSEVISERKEYLLFDRMVAFHVQRGVTVPLSSAEFYAGLSQRFSERDGMYFLPNQAIEYDKKRMKVEGVEQLSLFVSDEASARQWLREQLRIKPQTFQELHPQFIKEIAGWNKSETPLELSILLEQNFLRYDGKEPVPEQIHAYLSSNWKDLRNLTKDDPKLVAKAKDRWYVPDPSKAGDLEKLREKALLKEFEEYKQTKRKLKVFRLEAVRAGFKKSWQERDYKTIINVAEKIPNKVLEEDPKLLMWYDQAVTRLGGE